MKAQWIPVVAVLALMWLSHAGPAGAAGKITAPALTAAQVMADPALLHTRIRAANPGYQGQARFAMDPIWGLMGDFNEADITDLSGLRGTPFGALDLRGRHVSNLGPLEGMPLKFLGIEDTQVADLAPLKGMKLVKLYLNNTPVTDLSPLRGMPVSELMLAGTRVSDIGPLKGMPLDSLWLNRMPVREISPLAGCPLASLTLEGTRVSDLRPLKGMKNLTRLHIGETPVTDLTPLAGLRLVRLVFTPGNISKGMNVVRNMKTLAEIGTSLESVMPAREFWLAYDRKKGN